MSNKEQQQSWHHSKEEQQSKEIDDNHDKKQHVHKEKQEGRFSYSAEIQKNLVCQAYPFGFSKAVKIALQKRTKSS